MALTAVAPLSALPLLINWMMTSAMILAMNASMTTPVLKYPHGIRMEPRPSLPFVIGNNASEG